MRNKIFTKIIITTLLVTFLTFNVGRVTRVSAVGTTAAIAATAFIFTGAVYMSYVALTQGELVLPAAEELHNWLGGVGRRVAQYPSGSATYQEIYQKLAREPVTGALDDVWTWTQEKLKSFVNDFADTRIIENITGYYEYQDISNIPTNGFAYTFTFVQPTRVYNGFSFYPLSNYSLVPVGSNSIIFYDSSVSGKAVITPFASNLTIRNVLNSNGRYTVQYLNNGVWQTFTVNASYGYVDANTGQYVRPFALNNVYEFYVNRTAPTLTIGNSTTYPLFPFAPIYDAVNDEELPLVIPDSEVFHAPQWYDPDNENRPIIPWVPIPDFPTGVPVPPGYTGPPQWGFPLAELLDLLEELAEGLINIDAIARLINEFAGQHGDNYYLEYNDGDTNYYTYYQPTNYDNDTEYVTYNINVSEQDDVIPVDLNTISLYTQNRYLDQIKESAIAGSSMLRDLAVFWHDVDPEITYIVLGCCILVLIGAFTGKLGHS